MSQTEVALVTEQNERINDGSQTYNVALDKSCIDNELFSVSQIQLNLLTAAHELNDQSISLPFSSYRRRNTYYPPDSKMSVRQMMVNYAKTCEKELQPRAYAELKGYEQILGRANASPKPFHYLRVLPTSYVHGEPASRDTKVEFGYRSTEHGRDVITAFWFNLPHPSHKSPEDVLTDLRQFHPSFNKAKSELDIVTHPLFFEDLNDANLFHLFVNPDGSIDVESVFKGIDAVMERSTGMMYFRGKEIGNSQDLSPSEKKYLRHELYLEEFRKGEMFERAFELIRKAGMEDLYIQALYNEDSKQAQKIVNSIFNAIDTFMLDGLHSLSDEEFIFQIQRNPNTAAPRVRDSGESKFASQKTLTLEDIEYIKKKYIEDTEDQEARGNNLEVQDTPVLNQEISLLPLGHFPLVEDTNNIFQIDSSSIFNTLVQQSFINSLQVLSQNNENEQTSTGLRIFPSIKSTTYKQANVGTAKQQEYVPVKTNFGEPVIPEITQQDNDTQQTIEVKPSVEEEPKPTEPLSSSIVNPDTTFTLVSSCPIPLVNEKTKELGNVKRINKEKTQKQGDFETSRITVKTTIQLSATMDQVRDAQLPVASQTTSSSEQASQTSKLAQIKTSIQASSTVVNNLVRHRNQFTWENKRISKNQEVHNKREAEISNRTSYRSTRNIGNDGASLETNARAGRLLNGFQNRGRKTTLAASLYASIEGQENSNNEILPPHQIQTLLEGGVILVDITKVQRTSLHLRRKLGIDLVLVREPWGIGLTRADMIAASNKI